ncbi:MAG: SDR family NAD(P)-dependent oxidoreductase [Caldilineaceae bacterium]|nr:SDR family NAD(P)-dependent oxidoreductase [Caldilineaceae bacterium]
MHPLKDKIAVVAGATRGAGRGIACMLGAASATVYCTGRSTRQSRSEIDRPETIEETAEMVTAHGGDGLWAQVDHTEPEQVRAFFDRVRREQGRVDVLVNNMSGDQFLTTGMLSSHEPQSFWDYSIEKGIATQQNGVHTHLITSHYAAQMMVERKQGLIIEVNDGNSLQFNDVGVYYSLSKASLVLLAYFMAEELKPHHVTAVSLTPGWLRSELMLDGFGVTEANWQTVVERVPDFIHSETPFYIGRAVVALATDPDIMAKTGHALSAGGLAREYDFTDVDGRQPPAYSPEGMFQDGYFMKVKP